MHKFITKVGFSSLLSGAIKTLCGLGLAGVLSVAAVPSVNAEKREAVGLEVLSPKQIGATKKVELGLNKSLVVELPRDIRDILVANPEVADAIVRTSKKVFLIGNRVGQTNVFMFDQAGNTVLSLDLKVERDIGPLEELIEKYVPGSDVKVEIANDNVVLTGTVPNPLAASRAADLAQAFVTGGEATTGNFTQNAEFGGVVSDGGAVISNPDGAGRAQSQIINLLRIEGEDQVHLKVVVAEIRRTVLKQLGIDFSAASGGRGNFVGSIADRSAVAGASSFFQPGGFFGTLTNTTSSRSLSATLQALERANALRTLAEPTLTAQSGREATFLAGGQIGVPQTATPAEGGGVDVVQQFVDLGVSLSFTPVVQSAERISLTVATEVSDIDPTLANTFTGPVAIPAFAVRRATSTIELPSGGSMVIAGLLRDDIRQSSQGIPYLKNVPVLGPLFASSDFVRNETELVIIATPYLVRPTARKNLTTPDKNYAAEGDPKFYLLNRINRIYGGKRKPEQDYHGRVGFILK